MTLIIVEIFVFGGFQVSGLSVDTVKDSVVNETLLEGKEVVTDPVMKVIYQSNFSIFSAPIVADLNNSDNHKEIIVVENETLKCINSDSEAVEWSVDDVISSSVVVGEIDDGSDGLEVAFGSVSNIFYIRDSKGDILWSTITLGNVVSPSPIDNMNGKAGNEIVVGETSGKIGVLKGHNGGQVWGNCNLGLITSSPVIADIENDGYKEVVVCSFDGRVHVLNGQTGRNEWGRTTFGNIEHSPIVVDRMVFTISNNTVYCFDGFNGHEKWSRGSLDRINCIDLTDVDTDIEKEVVIGSSDGAVYVFDAETGDEDWSRTTVSSVSSLTIVDEDNTIVIGTGNGYVQAFDGGTGSEKWAVKLGNGTTHIVLTDIDEDSVLEIVGTSDTQSGGLVFVLDDEDDPDESDEPNLEVETVNGGFFSKVSAVIKNTGDANATDVNWKITVAGGIINKANAQFVGTIQTINQNESQLVEGTGLWQRLKMRGIGFVTITVEADTSNVDVKKTVDGLVFGGRLIVLSD